MKYLFLILSFLLVTDAFSQARRNIKAPNTIDGLQANVDFNKQDGGTYIDPISGADFTIKGSPPHIRGAHGRAVKCTGLSGDQLESTHPLWRLGTTDQDLGTPGVQTQSFCLGIWVTVEELGAIQTILTQFGSGQGAYSIFFTGDNGNATVRFRTPSGSPLASVIDLTGADGTNFATVGLNYILLCWDSTTDEASLRINDGTPTTATVDSTRVSTLPVTICSNAVGSDVKTSWVDNVRYWDRILSSTEATLEYNNGEGPLPITQIVRRKGTNAVVATLTAPNAPSLATGTPTTNSIPLTITPASTGDPASSYSIHYGTSTGSYSTTINVGTNLTPNVTGLSSNTEYFFVATASNSAGTSSNSSEVSETTAASGGGGTDTYTTLRNTSCSVGQTTNFTTDDGKADGIFECQASDPNGKGDDGGIVIKTTSGSQWWIRQWPYSASSPIELDWFELSNNQNITTLLANLADSYRPEYYVRMPSTSMTLLHTGFLDLTCSGHNVNRLRFLETPGVDVTIKQTQNHHTNTGNPYILIFGSNRPGTSFCTNAMLDVVIGTDVDKNDRDAYNLTFDGSVDGPCVSCKLARGIVNFQARGTGSITGHFRFKVKDAYIGALRIADSNQLTAIISGVYDSGVPALYDAHIVFDDTLLVGDPYARNWGWTGDVDGGVALIDFNGTRYGTEYGSHGFSPTFVNLRSLKGAIELNPANSPWGIFTAGPVVGTENEPFTFISVNAGFLGDGTPVEPPNVPSHFGKVDPLGLPGQTNPAPRYFKVIDRDNEFGSHPLLQNGMWFEATEDQCEQQGSSAGTWSNQNIVVTLVNLKDMRWANSKNYSAAKCGGEASHTSDNIFQGDGENPAFLNDQLTIDGERNQVRNGEFRRIWIRNTPYWTSTQSQPCHNNEIGPNVTATDIDIQSGCLNNILTDVTMSATQTIDAEESWICTGQGTRPSGSVQAQNVPGAQCSGGTCTICN